MKLCLIRAVEEGLGLEAKKKVQNISLSNTIKARIEHIKRYREGTCLNDKKGYEKVSTS